MAFFEEAKREAVPLMVGIAGPSGSGKTFSALLIAAGLAGPSGKVGLIDTELGRGSMYADDPDIIAAMPGGKYYRHEMTEPFTPEKYGIAIKQAVQAGISALVIDSASHEWEGLGGCQDIAEKNKLKGLPNWALAKLHHKRLMNQAAQSPLHIVFGLRARPKTKPSKNDKGEIVMVELGMQAIQEKNFMYEMTVSMMLDEVTNLPVITKCPKPLRPLFVGAPKLLTKDIGSALRVWAEGGAPIDTGLRSLKQRCRDAAMDGNAALTAFLGALNKDEKELIRTAGEAFKLEARALAAEADQVSADQRAAIQADPLAALVSSPAIPLDRETMEQIARYSNSTDDAFTAGAVEPSNQPEARSPAASTQIAEKAREIVAQAHAELEVAEAEKKAPVPAENEEPIVLNASTNYGLMTGEKLKQAVRQAIADLAEYAGDPEAIVGYWASINGKALMLGLSRKGMSTEKAKLDAIVPSSPKRGGAE